MKQKTVYIIEWLPIIGIIFGFFSIFYCSFYYAKHNKMPYYPASMDGWSERQVFNALYHVLVCLLFLSIFI